MFWIEEVRRHAPEAKILLVGNKTDLKDLRAVTHADAFQFATNRSLMYIESSAKDNTSVEYAFKVRNWRGGLREHAVAQVSRLAASLFV